MHHHAIKGKMPFEAGKSCATLRIAFAHCNAPERQRQRKRQRQQYSVVVVIAAAIAAIGSVWVAGLTADVMSRNRKGTFLFPSPATVQVNLGGGEATTPKLGQTRGPLPSLPTVEY